MNKERIEEEEFLVRAITDNPNIYLKENKRISSALFKDSKGVSVDRKDVRTYEEIYQLKKKELDLLNKNYNVIGYAVLQAKTCYDIGTLPLPKPLMNNIYHAEIHQSTEKIQLSNSCAKKLSKLAEVKIY